jgi:hypothetical protein
MKMNKDQTQKQMTEKLYSEALAIKASINVRSQSMLDKCSDEGVIILAESINAHKMAGLETHHLDKLLEEKMAYMFNCTKAFCGRLKEITNESINRD